MIRLAQALRACATGGADRGGAGTLIYGNNVFERVHSKQGLKRTIRIQRFLCRSYIQPMFVRAIGPFTVGGAFGRELQTLRGRNQTGGGKGDEGEKREHLSRCD